MRLQIIGFILTLVVGVLAAPLAAEAPPAGKISPFLVISPVIGTPPRIE
jgi:hypothetical protein